LAGDLEERAEAVQVSRDVRQLRDPHVLEGVPRLPGGRRHPQGQIPAGLARELLSVSLFGVAKIK